ncbi:MULTISPECIES: nicotinate-nucleotide--dimethylbenzimidazole phosphoribosyltransferase [Methylococcus]|uniref:Nicotinate-nucleotide--dimethylbenzimidazole phosphoribosyltransferase n=1 Tax=Methylococcus capsulatus TaxID=414 RepID=A0ABZ2F6G8_METCP|nr:MULTISPECIES: nicotinate-nucleotide--dimethylbenzimidazole phosphoribosyltransferase [Methylococcus]MDF9393629.1 nicotinate-nucleotide--dimethylbenzimidazole phosphoribosyltransferase [Methylococcus capsulatus]
MSWKLPDIVSPSGDIFRQALRRQTELTKPPGSLGRLENLAARLAAMQGSGRPSLERIWISVFAGDHGVAEEGVSAFPQSVTREMCRVFTAGGAAISVLARQIGAVLEVVDAGVAGPLASPGLVDARAGNGTANFTRQPAMSEAQRDRALAAGAEAVSRAKRYGALLFIGGEMGIANTTSAAALACALLGVGPERLAGPGTGLDGAGIRHKCEVIETALRVHGEALRDPAEILRHLGGFEIAALTGAYLAAAAASLPVLVDGFITTVAALLAVRMHPVCAEWFLYAHRSAEPGHRLVLEALGAEPLIDLGMRLGEGSGAAVVVPLLRAACALHNEMATFAEAGVSGG